MSEKDQAKKEAKEKEEKKAGIFSRREKGITLPEKDYAQLKKEAAEKKEIWEKYLRLYAEYENAKKLWQKQKEELLKFSNFRLLKELLGLYDEIKMAFASLANIDNEHRKGIEMIEKRMQNILDKENVKRIEAQGKKFDPFQHEVLGVEEKEDCEENTVLEILQDGYIYEGKVLRPAKVKISRKPAAKDAAAEEKAAAEQKQEEQPKN